MFCPCSLAGLILLLNEGCHCLAQATQSWQARLRFKVPSRPLSFPADFKSGLDEVTDPESPFVSHLMVMRHVAATATSPAKQIRVSGSRADGIRFIETLPLPAADPKESKEAKGQESKQSDGQGEHRVSRSLYEWEVRLELRDSFGITLDEEEEKDRGGSALQLEPFAVGASKWSPVRSFAVTAEESKGLCARKYLARLGFPPLRPQDPLPAPNLDNLNAIVQ